MTKTGFFTSQYRRRINCLIFSFWIHIVRFLDWPEVSTVCINYNNRICLRCSFCYSLLPSKKGPWRVHNKVADLFFWLFVKPLKGSALWSCLYERNSLSLMNVPKWKRKLIHKDGVKQVVDLLLSKCLGIIIISNANWSRAQKSCFISSVMCRAYLKT